MRRFSFAGTVVALGLLAACGSEPTGAGGSAGETTTSKTTSATGGAGGAGPVCGSVWSSTNAACSACMDEHCCDELAACGAGSECDALADCLRLCTPGNDTCSKACQSSHPNGKAGVDALIACFDASCQSSPACGTKVCDTGVSVDSQACGDCLTASCCDSWKLCSQESGCLDCLVTADAACAGNPLYASAIACQSASCGPVCQKTICDTSLGYPGMPACNDCLGKLDAEGGCCEETEACAADTTCRGCLTGKVTVGCDASFALMSFQACRAKCATPCGG